MIICCLHCSQSVLLEKKIPQFDFFNSYSSSIKFVPPQLNWYHVFQVYNYLVSANLESTDEAPIKLRSLYAANGGEPEFTNYTPGFTGTLDYIFLSDGSSIKPTRLLRLPRGDSVDVQGGLPNFQHPSDHLPIGADFLVANS
jgi:mRNA deadenylase 3'-5' endonuclease subunit Ccr4